MSDNKTNAWIVGIATLSITIWFTWPVILWLFSGTLLLWIVSALLSRWQTSGGSSRVTPFRVSLISGLREVLLSLVIGVGFLTLIQFVVNVYGWLFTDIGTKMSDRLWRSEKAIESLRAVLVGIFRPRVTLLLLASTLFVRVARPNWTPVKYIFGARRRLSRALQVVTVLASATFFTAEYAARNDEAFARVRLSLLREERDRAEQLAVRLASGKWLNDKLSIAPPHERKASFAFIKSAAATRHANQIVHAEAERLRMLWLSTAGDTRGSESANFLVTSRDREASRSPNGSAFERVRPEGADPDTDVLLDESVGRTESSVLAAVVDALAGPSAPRPTQADLDGAQARSDRLSAQVQEVEDSTLEAVKVGMGEVASESVPEVAKMFLEALTDTAAEGFVKPIFDKLEGKLSDRLRKVVDALGKNPSVGLGPDVCGDLVRGANKIRSPDGSPNTEPADDEESVRLIQERVKEADQSYQRDERLGQERRAREKSVGEPRNHGEEPTTYARSREHFLDGLDATRRAPMPAPGQLEGAGEQFGKQPGKLPPGLPVPGEPEPYLPGKHIKGEPTLRPPPETVPASAPRVELVP